MPVPQPLFATYEDQPVPAALREHWGQPEIYWFSGSHLAPFGRGRVVRRIASHLHGLRIL